MMLDFTSGFFLVRLAFGIFVIKKGSQTELPFIAM